MEHEEQEDLKLTLIVHSVQTSTPQIHAAVLSPVIRNGYRDYGLGAGLVLLSVISVSHFCGSLYSRTSNVSP